MTGLFFYMIKQRSKQRVDRQCRFSPATLVVTTAGWQPEIYFISYIHFYHLLQLISFNFAGLFYNVLNRMKII